MDPLRQEFNAQANWSINIAPLLMLLIMDDFNRRETRRRKRIDRLERQFNAMSLAESRQQYAKQIAAPRLRGAASTRHYGNLHQRSYT